MAKRSYVLDASVLLHDPEIFHHFKNHHLILPSVVIEELDRKKYQNDEIGKHARLVMRFIDNISKQGNIRQGVELENGSNVRVLLDSEQKKRKNLPTHFTPDRARHRFLSSAHALKEIGESVSVVSKDPVTKILAETIGVETYSYKATREHYDTLYKGVQHLELPKETIDQFYAKGQIPLPEGTFYPNEYCIMRSGENSSAIGKVQAKDQMIVPLKPLKRDIWGVKPRNVMQKCALDLLLDDNVKLVSLIGQAGTGKTLLALAAALKKTFDDNIYTRIIIARSIMPLGRDIGFLPGTKEEKLRAWLAPFFDNLDYICGDNTVDGENETKRYILESDKFQVEAITYMRGRSLSNTWIIIDEAQNLTPHELKTIISRVGENTKIVVLGDPTQIDNPYLDLDSNGLVYLVGRMKRYNLFGSIFFTETERSQLAALAAEVL